MLVCELHTLRSRIVSASDFLTVLPERLKVSAAERGQHGQPPVPTFVLSSGSVRGLSKQVTAARSFPTTPVIWTCLLFQADLAAKVGCERLWGQVTTALLLAVLEVVPPIVLTDEASCLLLCSQRLVQKQHIAPRVSAATSGHLDPLRHCLAGSHRALRLG